MANILLLHGPNLNLLGTREPDVYGIFTLDELVKEVRGYAKGFGFEVDALQSNYEGALIDALHSSISAYDGVLINPGAYAHYSYAIRDAVAAIASVGVPTVEVHLTDVTAREAFRYESVVAPVCAGYVYGKSKEGYFEALDILAQAMEGVAKK